MVRVIHKGFLMKYCSDGSVRVIHIKVRVGNDHGVAQSERNSHS